MIVRTAARLCPAADGLEREERQPSLAKFDAPKKSTTIAGRSPTTQASWPFGRDVMSPGSATN